MAANQHVFLLESVLQCAMGGTHTYSLSAHKTLEGAQAMAASDDPGVAWTADPARRGLPGWLGMVGGKLRWRISEELLRN